MTTNRWFFPVFCLVLGLLMGVPTMLRGDVGLGIAFVAIMVGYAAILMLTRRRSETTSILSGELSDERHKLNELRARGATANVLALVTVGGFLVQVWRGEDATAFAALGAVGGLTYIAALVYHSRRG
ncbi:hypothetical protein [Bailinhaonella thermotolerans]|uniref:DUF2178 domain-containing protein n=1 Tax=Bailinhaonella thermotolerans TaxID=1070861 RepID=A0A3A4A7B1_9ACTN|nr:hypothetical protein [Bailinhaonella thermotolerans]RJL20835.1 hypothetical protein D5H75_38975 [Bailinhaonella thermotolerans]